MNRLPRFGIATRARVVAALAAGVTASGCGSSTPPAPAPATGTPALSATAVPAPASPATPSTPLSRAPLAPVTQPAPGNGTAEDRAAVETVFRTYLRAVADGDFATACALNAPETNQRLLDELARRGTPAPTCETAIATLYAGSGVAQGAATIADTLSVERVDVDGDAATVAWSVEVSGRRPLVTNALRRVDGQWRLLPTPDPTG
jgi:predicted lipid-binding transport protein (Tim44 family)